MAVEAPKQIHRFDTAPLSKDLLGGKGYGLAKMTQDGLPVPYGFTIDTTACKDFFAEGRKLPAPLWRQTRGEVSILEDKSGKKFGDSQDPLLVSVRSGAKFSMPGMMDTILNVGLNDESVEGLAAATDNPRFAYDSYRRLIQMFGSTVMGVEKEKFDHALDQIKSDEGVEIDKDLTADALRRTVTVFKEIVRDATGEEFPQDPYQQLQRSIGAVFDSWYGDRAVEYRRREKIDNNLGTAVNIVTMVFGNTGEDSGTGVAFSRNPMTGEPGIYGDYLENAQGEDVVAGIRTPREISTLAETLPSVYADFTAIAEALELGAKDMQDIEFTVEKGKVWILQTRNGKRSAIAAIRIATDMVDEQAITREDALAQVTPAHVEQLLSATFVDKEKNEAIADGRLLTKGIAASPGAAVGEIVLDAETAKRRAAELKAEGSEKKVILVRPETAASDYAGMMDSGGILTARGGKTSHAAVVARGAGITAVVGASELKIDTAARTVRVNGRNLNEGDIIAIDGSTGEVILGELTKIEPQGLTGTQRFSEFLEWADDVARLEVWANADTPADARRAREYGAKGIGLCRTEHMFVGSERHSIFQRMIMAAEDAKRYQNLLRSGTNDIPGDEQDRLREKRTVYTDSLAKLLEFQKDDFTGILKEMDGLPVIIRLLDPPLHEFLPNLTTLTEKIAIARAKGTPEPELAEDFKLLETVKQMHEENPMMGLRGVRLGLMYPEIYQMQVRAVVEAAAKLKKDGHEPKPKIMIPFVWHAEEMRLMREILEKEAKTTMAEQGVELDVQFGAMIETPRAAITADEIAEHADFFSFGTNDLTQFGLGLSRDDVEGNVLPAYIEQGIIAESPFATLDQGGVGKLVRRAVVDGRQVKPDLSIGICGEHGGEPVSIGFFHGAELSYVSASPNRVPVARLAAAQAVLNSTATTK